MKSEQSKIIGLQKWVFVVSVLLLLFKLTAWVYTGSVAILTDALESIVNVVAGIMGLYSLNLSNKPKDTEHPYGHGKVEFITSAIEGVLIMVAALFIVFEATQHLLHPQAIRSIDFGIVVLLLTSAVNYALGWYCSMVGKQSQSVVLMGSGAHLKSDTYSTLGIVIGVVLVKLTNALWLDASVAILFSLIILRTGYKIIRQSVSGIMDETDMLVVDQIVNVLNEHRSKQWIDVHNVRVINYAGFYHIDCHLTVPYYINVNEAHQQMDAFTALLHKHFNGQVEFFVHIDGCVPQQCKLCQIQACSHRQTDFDTLQDWTRQNLLDNAKHGLQ